MKRQPIASGGVWAITVAMLMGLTSGAIHAEDPATGQAKANTLCGRFVTLTVQDVGDRSYTGLLIALPQGAGLETVLVGAEQREKLLEQARQLEPGQVVNIAFHVEADHKWAEELSPVAKPAETSTPPPPEVAAAAAEGEGAKSGETAKTADATTSAETAAAAPAKDAADPFADADARARARIRQLEQRVAELEQQVRTLNTAKADAEKAAATAAQTSTGKDKEKEAAKGETGHSAGKVAALTKKSVDGKTLPAVVVSTDDGPTAFVVPLIENDKGEKAYDPAVRSVIEGLKIGQQVRITWQIDGKEKTIKAIEALPDSPQDQPDWGRRRRRG